MTQQTMFDIRGYNAYNRPAGWRPKIAAHVINIAVLVVLFLSSLLALGLIGIDIYPSRWLGCVLIFAGEAALFFVAIKRGFKQSPGEWLWGLSPGTGIQKTKLAARHSATAICLTLASSFLAGWMFLNTIIMSPVFSALQTDESTPFMPETNPQAHGEWAITPFFYTLGAWPKTFNGRPVFYSLPYEKGPPARFVGHIVARWEMPETFLTFEGPRTPHGDFTRSETRECLNSHALGRIWNASHTFRCMELREQVLVRHLVEIRKAGLSDISLKWLRVENRALALDEQIEGIFISASSERQAQTRFVLITPKGAHQAMILNTGGGDKGASAVKLFSESVRSLRASDDLSPGRAWVDRQLETVNLKGINSHKPASAADLVVKLSEIQTLLVSKISVDPKTFDSYFHLGGTALILARHAAANKDLKSWKEDWAAIARPLAQSAYHYAKDVAPDDPRTSQLQNLWLEAKKY